MPGFLNVKKPQQPCHQCNDRYHQPIARMNTGQDGCLTEAKLFLSSSEQDNGRFHVLIIFLHLNQSMSYIVFSYR